MQNFEGMIPKILKYLLYRTQLTSLIQKNISLMETRPAHSEPPVVEVEFSTATIIIHKNDISFTVAFYSVHRNLMLIEKATFQRSDRNYLPFSVPSIYFSAFI